MSLTGPVQGGQGPFGSPAEDLSPYGYVIEEFRLDGVARSLRPTAGSVPGPDGRWSVEWADEAEFHTRFYVVRPRDPEAFSGVVFVNWQNVTAGVDLGMPAPEIYRGGHAWVGVTAQRIGVVGMPARPGFVATTGLVGWDPQRYGSLRHPGDAWSYDIFAQAARLFAPGRTIGEVDPLGGLRPTTLIAMGGSQSAMRLGSYLNMVHPLEPLFDGFLLTVHWGICPYPPDQTLMESFVPRGDGLTAGSARIRADIRVPVLVLCSESEAMNNFPMRQPDTDLFRFWEMAGAGHTGSLDPHAAVVGIPGRPAPPPGLSPNTVPWPYVVSAAIRHLLAWVRDGVAPPRFEPIDIAGTPATICRDEWGNATGGIRLPDVVAPMGRHRGSNDGHPAARLLGETIAFTPEQVSARYPDRAAYLSTWDSAVDALVAAGLDIGPDVPALRERARLLADQAFAAEPAAS